MKLIKRQVAYINKQGEQKKATRFYLVDEGNNKEIAISPYSYGDKGDTFAQLNYLAEFVKDNK